MLTTNAVIEALKAAVAEKGEDYVYPAAKTVEPCFYADPQTQAPSCIVGHVLYALDRPAYDAAAQYEAEHGESFEVDDFDEYAPDLHLDEDAQSILASVQRRQDKGVAWGTAVKQTLAELR